MRELDALLLMFVEAEAARLTERELVAFEDILELPDPVLHSYLLGLSAPAAADTAKLIERVRAAARSRS
jgi:succinate dehydrogenase flavin-adding protein (antitoxin of CptAB toxin-antitoxin module)